MVFNQQCYNFNYPWIFFNYKMSVFTDFFPDSENLTFPWPFPGLHNPVKSLASYLQCTCGWTCFIVVISDKQTLKFKIQLTIVFPFFTAIKHKKQKQTKLIKIHQSQLTDMTFWPGWSELLLPNRSAKMTDGSKSINSWSRVELQSSHIRYIYTATYSLHILTVPQVWRLFEGGAYLKFGCTKDLNLLQLLKTASFDCQYSSLAEERSCASCPGTVRGLHTIYRTT